MKSLCIKRRLSAAGGQSGFTLVETIAVLVVVSILAVTALVRIPPLEDHTRVIEINTLKSHLRYAQAMAMATEKVWSIAFDDPSTYRMLEVDSSGDSPRVLPGADIADAALNPDRLPETVNLSGLKVKIDTVSRINFNAMGAPVDDAGTTELVADVTIQEIGGASLFVVTAVTGFIQ